MICVVCQKKADTKCVACKCVPYCSRECQKSDWKSHKKFCNSFVIKEEEEEKDGLKFTRRSIVAAKDLERGDYILEESPLFQISRLPCTFNNPEPSKKEEKAHHLYCCTCGSRRSINKFDRCKWPVCVNSGRNCGKHQLHAENECGILASKNINYDSLEAFEDRRVLLIVRAQAVKEKKPEVWNELMKRADEFSKAGKDSANNREEISKLEDIMKRMKISKEDVIMYKNFFHLLNLTSTFYSSYQEMDIPMGIAQGRMGDFLYPLSNYFALSCAPNCSFAIDGHPNYKIQVRASRSIKKGEELTISIDELIFPLFEGTIERRKMIKERFGYLCKCKRCSDPTEFGTFFSGIVCQVCRPLGENPNQLEENVGYFLPFDPESKPKEEEEEEGIAYSPLVQCNKCKAICSYSIFKELLSSADKQFEKKGTGSGKSARSRVQELHQECERVKLLLSKYKGKFLHPNHFFMHRGHSAFSESYCPEMFSSSNSSNSGEENIKRMEIWKDHVHFSKIQEALENKLLDGSLMFSQISLQDDTAGGLNRLAELQTMSDGASFVEAELIEAIEKVKESIQILEGAIHFQTKQMPTFFRRSFELASNKEALENNKGQLQKLNMIHSAFTDSMAKDRRRQF